MADYQVYFNQVREHAVGLSFFQADLWNIISDLDAIRSNLATHELSLLAEDLKSLRRRMIASADLLAAYVDFLENAADRYLDAETSSYRIWTDLRNFDRLSPDNWTDNSKLTDLFTSASQFLNQANHYALGLARDAVDAYSWLKQAISEDGSLYESFLYGKSVVKLIGGAKGIYSSLKMGYWGLPSLIFNYNSLVGASSDLYFLSQDMPQYVGTTNGLKDMLVGASGQIGEWLGDQTQGENVGEVIYLTGDAISTLLTTSNMLDSGKLFGIVAELGKYAFRTMNAV